MKTKLILQRLKFSQASPKLSRVQLKLSQILVKWSQAPLKWSKNRNLFLFQCDPFLNKSKLQGQSVWIRPSYQNSIRINLYTHPKFNPNKLKMNLRNFLKLTWCALKLIRTNSRSIQHLWIQIRFGIAWIESEIEQKQD